MDLKLLTEAEYRELDADGLEEQRSAILASLDGESEHSLDEIRSQAELCEAEISRRNTAVQLRNQSISALQAGAGSLIERSQEQVKPAEDMFDTEEYRVAFKEYICRGVAIPEQYSMPAEMRSDATTMTTDASAVIPTTLVNRIISKLETYGNIWNKVTKLNIKGGVEIPLMDTKPTASWIGEGASDDQKLTADETISFKYHGIECKIAQSLLVATVTLKAFEDKFVELAFEAMIKAIESAIINGDGSGKPLGITKDTRVTNVVELTIDELADWEAWHKKVKAKIPKAYRNGEFIMAQSSFDGYIDGMVDANGQPVGRVNYGIDGGEVYRFMGKQVETVEEDLLPDFATADAGDVVAIYGKLSDYYVNSNMQITAAKWIDHDDNKVKNKCLAYIDGRIADPHGFILIKLKNASGSTGTTGDTGVQA